MISYEKYIQTHFRNIQDLETFLIGFCLNLGNLVVTIKLAPKNKQKEQKELLQFLVYQVRYLKENYPKEYQNLLTHYPYMKIENLLELQKLSSKDLKTIL